MRTAASCVRSSAQVFANLQKRSGEPDAAGRQQPDPGGRGCMARKFATLRQDVVGVTLT